MTTIYYHSLCIFLPLAFAISSLAAEMTFTPGDGNVTIAVNYQIAIIAAVGKNVTVVVLGITINYINATMIHTFNKHHVRRI